MKVSGSSVSKAVNLQLADMVAQGMTGNAIAEALDLRPETVSRKKKALKPLIDALSVQYYLKAAPVTVDSSIKALEHANEILSHAGKLQDINERVEFLAKAKDFLAVTDKKEARVLVGIGVSPSPTQSVFVQNVFQGGQQVIINPQISSMFGQLGQIRTGDEDVIDVDVRELEVATGDPIGDE